MSSSAAQTASHATLVTIPDFIVVTGAPNSGKTTTLRLLQERGLRVVEEQARKIINEGTYTPAKDLEEFNVINFRYQLDAEEVARSCGASSVFFDRGLYDPIAYFKANLRNLPDYLATLAHSLYRVALVLDIIPEWNSDGVRHEDVAFAKRIDPIFEEVYRERGVETIRIPVLPPEVRVDLILSILGRRLA